MTKLRPTVSWNITGACNCRCSYCVQKHSADSGSPSDEELDRALATLAALPGSWEVKVSGGEPFLFRRLHDVASRLNQSGHLVSVLTNLSAPVSALERFIAAAGAGLRTFSCSLHREATTVERFLEKAKAVRDRVAAFPKATFVVNCVLVPGQISEAAQCRALFAAHDIKFYPQLMRRDGQPVRYPPADLEAIAESFGDLSGSAHINRGASLTGRLCHAGSQYFILHPRGDAFRCYPSKRLGDGSLGNVFEGTLRRWSAPQPCPYAVCPCTVPQNRGVIEGLDTASGQDARAPSP